MVVSELLDMAQKINDRLQRYVNLCTLQIITERDLPVKQMKADINAMYELTKEIPQFAMPMCRQSIEFNFDKMEKDILGNDIDDVIFDLKNIVYHVFNYSEMIKYLYFLYMEKIKSEKLTTKRFIDKYENSEDREVKELVDYVKQHGKTELINYAFADKYHVSDIEVNKDEKKGLLYTMYKREKMYMSRNYASKEQAAAYIQTLYVEQDMDSPHCYQKDGYEVNEGDIVIDAGAAEGNFSLDIIHKVKKLYLIEYNKAWLEALRVTFAPYKNKVVFVDKFLDAYDDDTHISIDGLLNGKKVDYIKMDIEGSEVAALSGAKNTFKLNDNLKCCICSYHKKGNQEKIAQILSDSSFRVDYSAGYMFFQWEDRGLIDLDLRRGLTRGVKTRHTD